MQGKSSFHKSRHALTRHTRIKATLSHFLSQSSPAATELKYTSPFELLVAVMLSAQCTDKRVNATTPALFEAYPTAERMALASFDELFPYIKSISYPNSKTRHLIATARLLVERHGGKVPSTTTELQELPGVGRKTANVIAAELYDAAVMAVDTHVFRVSKRMQLVPKKAKTPLAVEQALTSAIPRAHIRSAHHWLILHGRYVCTARRPRCGSCGLRSYCPSAEKFLEEQKK